MEVAKWLVDWEEERLRPMNWLALGNPREILKEITSQTNLFCRMGGDTDSDELLKRAPKKVR